MANITADTNSLSTHTQKSAGAMRLQPMTAVGIDTNTIHNHLNTVLIFNLIFTVKIRVARLAGLVLCYG